MNTKKQNYTLPIVMMFALFAMIAFVTNLCSPMAVIVKNQFGASNFAAQLGNAANFIAYAVMGIPSGLLLEKIGYKIRAAQQVDRVPYMLVLGAKEAEAGNISVRDRKGETTEMSLEDFIAKVTTEIRTRSL